jgi:membrane associated rhomboid family serine protease
MIPIRAETQRRTPAVVTGFLILLNVLVFLYQISLGQRTEALVWILGLIPARVESVFGHPGGSLASAFLPLLTSMFLHGGLLHLLGNMLFLWVFGASVEDAFGHWRYLIFYLICGIFSGMAHVLVNWGSQIPSVGASGAISGVMGAYVVLFPTSKIVTLVPLIIFFFTVRLPALLILGYWFVIQFLSGVGSLAQPNEGGVAWWAHIGGFLFGMFLTLGFREGVHRARRATYY